jgi:nucleotide-binding universal stress UspA family protein
MHTLLVPIDFSDASRAAGNYAASLAKTLNARLLLFHSYMLPTPVSEVPYIMVTVDELQKDNERMIRQEAAALQNTFGVEVDWDVQIGMPSDEIKNIAIERKMDLIVIGTRGAGGIEKLIGSTATNVVRKAKTPVLVVPHDAVYKQVKTIIYASDFSYTISQDLFQPLIEIARRSEAKLHIIHIRKEKATEASTKEVTSRNTTSTLLNSIDHEFTIITDESIVHGINSYVDQHDAQMLVMVAHKHSFFERVFSRQHTSAMTYETKIPLLVLQDKF